MMRSFSINSSDSELYSMPNDSLSSCSSSAFIKGLPQTNTSSTHLMTSIGLTTSNNSSSNSPMTPSSPNLSSTDLSSNMSINNSTNTNPSSSIKKNNFYVNQQRKAKFVVILMGLPATGKSTIASQLIEYLKSSSFYANTSLEPPFNCSSPFDTSKLRYEIYNAGNVRRNLSHNTLYELKNKSFENNNNHSNYSDVFDPKNSLQKENFARITLHNLLDDIDADKVDFAIFDATNSTTKRRHYVLRQLSSYNLNPYSNFIISPIVLEIKCNHPNFIKFNIHNKSFNKDYFDKPYNFSVTDFSKRLKTYRSQYSPFKQIEFDSYIEATTNVRSLYTPPDEFLNVYHGCAYFSIVNLGIENSSDFNLKHFYKDCPNEPKFIVNLISSFTKNYNHLFGKHYFNIVNEFFNTNINMEKQEKLSVLDKIINKDYLHSILT
ncbi:hypothetical protein TBLA_0A07930 [Henningerozyma blattae CBS 6284]|uniref:6-phosphofructo-2-kinase domain-containing protein n=1 Tax=Henningerozyma blattae (strain ATCC 34711 / CBS 6284 / DSM 70876 / NBRC 10599 / NRRL Y-10934 / UCD 77-7) TaxID=1071380 RepID=I2GWT0_HENB6|nr:hypothetical protein TBLA_0A07930 [Tetrapisispora blattae CBS 6284]CCH58582.1 hypothetical protein TBLA_0A07930 [Tetrapisispora blattae CBS 6284]